MAILMLPHMCVSGNVVVQFYTVVIFADMPNRKVGKSDLTLSMEKLIREVDKKKRKTNLIQRKSRMPQGRWIVSSVSSS